jgi:hypothetical protein
VTKSAGVACRWWNSDDGFCRFEAKLAREEKGGEGGGMGLFIGARFLAGGGRVARGEEDRRWRCIGLGRVSGQRKKETCQVGPACQRGEGLGRIPFRIKMVLGRGCFGGWADLVPLGPFLFS